MGPGATSKVRLLTSLLIVTAGLAALLAWLAAGRVSHRGESENASSVPVVVGSMAVAAFNSSMTFNAGAGNAIKLTLEDNVTSSSIANPAPGQSLTLLLCQDSTGGHTMSWPANLKLSGGECPLTPEQDKCDALTAVFDGVNWYETSRAMNEQEARIFFGPPSETPPAPPTENPIAPPR